MTVPKLRFLVADPLEGVQVFCRRLLEAYGFEPGLIACVADSQTALAAARQAPPDFLLTDWFPKGNPTGPELAAEVQQLQPSCRIGFLSFVVDASVEAEAARLRSRFVLKKPFDAATLRAKVQEAFGDLAKAHPELMRRVLAESQGRLDPRRRIELPPLPPPLKVGDAVVLAGVRHKVQAVVLSKGEQYAQLVGVRELVPAHKLAR